jgi:stearoyl-CoA 9-desaturase NADPH oxidoreductase
MAMSRGTLTSGLLDLLAGPPGVDGYLEQVSPMWVRGACRAKVVGVERSTPDSVTLALYANRAWEGYRAGQFVRIGVEIDGSWCERCYSPASVAGLSRELELTVKRDPEGLVSSLLFASARPGMVLRLSQAQGDFRLPDRRPERILLISAGSGITPVMSMLRTLCAEGHRGPVTFLHYAPDPERAIYREPLDELAAAHPNLRVVRSYTRAPGAGEADGRFSASQLEAVEPFHADAETFACGPPSLLDALRETWCAAGVDAKLHTESFVSPSLAAADAAADGTVDFAASGVRAENTGAALLEQAEEAGLSPDFGCRMGICHTCSCRKTAGKVRNLSTGEVSTSDEEEIQICVSAPIGDVVVDL